MYPKDDYMHFNAAFKKHGLPPEKWRPDASVEVKREYDNQCALVKFRFIKEYVFPYEKKSATPMRQRINGKCRFVFWNNHGKPQR